jgi:hypothetical protein
MARPLNVTGLQGMAYDVSRLVPGANWHLRFQSCHPEVLNSKPSGLDLKCAQNFNLSNIEDYFVLLGSVYKEFPDIPPQHIWNMDEKSIQMGGGRK